MTNIIDLNEHKEQKKEEQYLDTVNIQHSIYSLVDRFTIPNDEKQKYIKIINDSTSSAYDIEMAQIGLDYIVQNEKFMNDIRDIGMDLNPLIETYENNKDKK